MLDVFSNDQEVVDLLGNLSRERLTAKQKEIIRYVSGSDQKVHVTRLVGQLAEHLDCAETTVWNNINQLKRIGILSYGNSCSKGIPVQITRLGWIISEELGGE